MVRRKNVRKRKFTEFQKIEKEIGEEVEEVEKWIIERRKFFIKLGIIVILILLLLLYSRFFIK